MTKHEKVVQKLSMKLLTKTMYKIDYRCVLILQATDTLQTEPACFHSPPSSMLFFSRSVSLENTDLHKQLTEI